MKARHKSVRFKNCRRTEKETHVLLLRCRGYLSTVTQTILGLPIITKLFQVLTRIKHLFMGVLHNNSSQTFRNMRKKKYEEEFALEKVADFQD